MRRILAIFLSLLGSTTFAGVGTSLMQTANVLAPGSYEVKIQNDIIFNRGGGYNVSPHFVFGVIEHYVDVDSYIGTGTTDFQIGALGKLNLFPDLPEQFGLSLNLGIGYQRDKVPLPATDMRLGINSFLFTFGALASKEITTTFGSMTPYTSFQFEGLIRNQNQPSTVPLSLLVGTRWAPSDLDWKFYSELNMNLNESFWSLGLGAAYNF